MRLDSNAVDALEFSRYDAEGKKIAKLPDALSRDRDGHWVSELAPASGPKGAPALCKTVTLTEPSPRPSTSP